MGNQFIVLVRPNFQPGVIYQMTEIEVTANSWGEAYQVCRDNGYIPRIDEINA